MAPESTFACPRMDSLWSSGHRTSDQSDERGDGGDQHGADVDGIPGGTDPLVAPSSSVGNGRNTMLNSQMNMPQTSTGL